VDDSFEEGMEIPIYYDPMLAKLIVWGKTRSEAIALMLNAIDAYQVSGVKTNLDFCKYVLKHKAFTSGDFDTNFIKHYFSSPELVKTAMQEEKTALEAAVETLWNNLQEQNKREFISKPIHGAWKLMVR
jgi:propionyl-CoA carboxylase alpha chain